jgi:hypothetical protein
MDDSVLRFPRNSRDRKLDNNIRKANMWCDTRVSFAGTNEDGNSLRGICLVHDPLKGFRLREQRYNMSGSCCDISNMNHTVVGILMTQIPHCMTKGDIEQTMKDIKEDRRNRFFMHELAQGAFGKFRTPFEIAECTLSFTTPQLIRKLRTDVLKLAEKDVYAIYDVARCYDGLPSNCEVDGIPFWSKDAKQALIWYQRAAALGHRGAEESVLRLKEMAEGWYGVPQCLRWNIRNNTLIEGMNEESILRIAEMMKAGWSLPTCVRWIGQDNTSEE